MMTSERDGQARQGRDEYAVEYAQTAGQQAAFFRGAGLEGGRHGVAVAAEGLESLRPAILLGTVVARG
jgi:hypothetical protein